MVDKLSHRVRKTYKNASYCDVSYYIEETRQVRLLHGRGMTSKSAILL